MHAFRIPGMDIYRILPPNFSDASHVLLTFFVTTINWFLNGCVIALLSNQIKKLNSKIKRYGLIFSVSAIFIFAVVISCLAVVVGFGDSSEPPINPLLDVTGHACGLILAIIMWPENFFHALLGGESQGGYLSAIIFALAITAVFYVYKEQKKL